jgi:hypothetical protein
MAGGHGSARKSIHDVDTLRQARIVALPVAAVVWRLACSQQVGD